MYELSRQVPAITARSAGYLAFLSFFLSFCLYATTLAAAASSCRRQPRTHVMLRLLRCHRPRSAQPAVVQLPARLFARRRHDGTPEARDVGDPYLVLGVTPGADTDAIKCAFRSKVRAPERVASCPRVLLCK